MRTRKNIRLTGYDYSHDGVYFITICSHERENIFAQIGVGAPLGTQIYLLWTCARTYNNQQPVKFIQTIQMELTEIGKIIDNQWNEIPNQFDSVSLDEFIVMPNHVHCIVIIQKRAQTSSAPTLGHVVRAFKSMCSMEYLHQIKTNGTYKPVKIWQRSYYDHIIRDEESLNKIREYIRNNPETWEEDKNNLMQQGHAPDRLPGR
jgi:REP element-mobilizing transposase RayT